MAIDLHERAGAQQWIHRAIIHTDESILAVAHVQLLNQRNRDFPPYFNHP
jgi:hypothetical protein